MSNKKTNNNRIKELKSEIVRLNLLLDFLDKYSSFLEDYIIELIGE